jgi:hypothetical protein
MEVGLYHDYLEAQVGKVRLSVLHQRLRDEHGLRASWGTFYPALGGGSLARASA